MGRTITQKGGLTDYGVGEIVDMTGTPTFYDAGTSKWLRTGQFTPVSNLTTETVDNFRSASVTNVQLSALNMPDGVPNWVPPAYIAATDTCCVSNGARVATVKVVTLNPEGVQEFSTGQTSFNTANAAYGTNRQVIGDGTYFYCYTFQSSTVMTMSRSTDGINWTPQSMTGLPTFAIGGTTRVMPSGTGTNSSIGPMYRNTLGERWEQFNNDIFQWYFCGAKHLVIARGSGNVQVASLSSDGITWSGDNTTAVLGSTAIPSTKYENWWFWRNGNSCFLFTPTTTASESCRYTTDGGATWANSTGAIPVKTAGNYFGYSSTNDSYLYQINTSNTTLRISLDHGATWTTKTLPSSGYTNDVAYGYRGGFVWKGNTMLMMKNGGDTYRSVDNGSNWVQVIQPPSLTLWLAIYCDGTNFYATNNTQIFISTDGITWLTRSGEGVSLSSANGVASFDANNKIIFAYSSCAFSTDGGVTWKGAQINSFNQNSGPLGQHPFVTPSLGALGKVLLGGRGSGYVSPGKIRAVELSSLTAGGSQAKNGNTITSLRSSALAFVRVE